MSKPVASVESRTLRLWGMSDLPVTDRRLMEERIKSLRLAAEMMVARLAARTAGAARSSRLR